MISSAEFIILHFGVHQPQSKSESADNEDEHALRKCLLLLTPLMKLVGLAAGKWASDHGRAHGGGRIFFALCK